ENNFGLRGRGRPRGSKNAKRVASIETINKMARPVQWQCDALRRGWVKTKGVREYLSLDQKITLARDLSRKVLPDLRSVDASVTGEMVQQLVVVSGISRSPCDPPLSAEEHARWQQYATSNAAIDTEAQPVLPLPDNSGAPSTQESVTTAPGPDAVEA